MSGVATHPDDARGADAAAAAERRERAAAAKRALREDRNFRWIFAGGLVSMLGDQFTLVALPWLVLRLTGDPLALGGVLAAMGIPRAVFILVGGALVDRHSPTRILSLAKLANAALLLALAGLGALGVLTAGLTGALALGIGLVTAFSYPAGSAILPQALPPALLAG
jgi:MFS family permease